MSSAAARTGDVVAGYALGEVLGTGGAATVFATRGAGGQPLAIKVVPHDPHGGLGPRQAHDLEVIASMAIPFLVQLRRARRPPPVIELVGESPGLAAVATVIERVAPTDLSVMITGATGTGKEVAARALHAASGRRERPMIAVNCAAVPAGLLEAELFGHRKGAFTGATADRIGKFEAAHGSTLFLDEIGDMPLAMQASLLRVLQEREVVRLGENQARVVDVRVVTATHRDLDRAVADGSFRADRAHGLGADAEAALAAHPWPGNVRELRATMRRAAVLADGATIRAADLGLTAARARPADGGLGDLGRTLDDARDEFTRRYVAAVVERHGGNREAAAAALGISLRSLYRYQA